MKLSLGDLQQRVGGELEGERDVSITGVNDLRLAQPGDIAFAEHERYLEAAKASQASALVVTQDFPDLPGKNVLRVKAPRQSFVQIMALFEEQVRPFDGIHPTAVIAEQGVCIGEDVTIGEHVVIREQVKLGNGTVIDSGVHVGAGVALGQQCIIGPNVVLQRATRIGNRVTIHAGSVIGGDGFGYVWTGDHHRKIPQLGTVQIDDDVEIGCNVCIDRATFGVTRIHRGTKIDNLVQIAHNNDIGAHCILVSQVGLAGSVSLEDNVTLAGQVGVADHITIGRGATAAARTGVSKDIKPGEVSWGAPNRPMKQVLRELASLSRLPSLFKQVRALAERIAALETQRTMHDPNSDHSKE